MLINVGDDIWIDPSKVSYIHGPFERVENEVTNLVIFLIVDGRSIELAVPASGGRKKQEKMKQAIELVDNIVKEA